MARGPRRTQSEILKDQMEKVNERIVKLEEQIKEAKAQRKSIEQELKKTELDALLALMDERNLSVEAIREMIQGSEA